MATGGEGSFLRNVLEHENTPARLTDRRMRDSCFSVVCIWLGVAIGWHRCLYKNDKIVFELIELLMSR